MKKFLLFLINFLGIISFSHALIINEIMYDPQGSDTSREWIEVYNDTSGDINLSSWKFFESGTNHGLVTSQGGVTIPASGYAVIADNPAKFLLDYPAFSGILFDSSFSLSNSGELIVMKDGSSVQIDSVNYSASIGGNDDGSTLSFISGSWMRGQATPSSVNIASLIIPLEATSAATSTTESTVSIATLSRAVTSAPGADITFILPEDRTVVAGADANFTARAITSDKKQIDGLNYTWSFGDGGSKVGKSVIYNYSYPGYYIAYLEAQNEHISGSDRIRVRVISPDIDIPNSGNDERGAFVDLKNNSGSDMDISHWFLDLGGLRYPLPANTIINGGKVTRFSGKATGFSCATGTVRLLFPDGGIVAIKSTTTVGILAIADSTKPMVLGVSTTTVSVKDFPEVTHKKEIIKSRKISKEIIKPVKDLSKEINKDIATTSSTTSVSFVDNRSTSSSSSVKIITNKNTGIATWLRKLFSW